MIHPKYPRYYPFQLITNYPFKFFNKFYSIFKKKKSNSIQQHSSILIFNKISSPKFHYYSTAKVIRKYSQNFFQILFQIFFPKIFKLGDWFFSHFLSYLVNASFILRKTGRSYADLYVRINKRLAALLQQQGNLLTCSFQLWSPPL